MRALAAAFLSVTGLTSLAGAVLLSAVIWVFAPALLDVGTLGRAALTLVPLLAWAMVIAVLAWRRSRRDRALLAGVTEVAPPSQAAPPAAQAESAEEREVAKRLAEALGSLRTATGGKGGYLYERPWYVIVGPPGAGKTTAIRNSGLKFPLSPGPVAGVGGTRNCDWWIAEDAVLIDTAGRYTTQDSDPSVDRAGWERFLDLLRRERPLQPLNGIIVAFGVDLLSRLDQSGRDEHAFAVRKRIREAEARLGQRLPVYVLVTKADLVAGFTEFFDDLDRNTREQVWGTTFPSDSSPEGQVALFGSRFAALVERLNEKLLERLQSERSPEKRARIAGFPAQFASLEPVVSGFLQSAFGGSKLDPAPFMRGVYFTSGTQTGTPIDRLTGVLSRAFGLDPRRPAAASGQTGQAGKSYFLGRLLRDVVFNEARLAARDRRQLRVVRLLQAGAWAASLALIAVGAALAWQAVTSQASENRELTAAIERAEVAARGLPLEQISPTDELVLVVPYLDRVRDVVPVAEGLESGFVPGLSQREKLVTASRLAYGRVLDRVLLPRLLAKLETQIRAGMQRPEYLYEATRVYLMLGRKGPLDRALVKEWMALEWEQAFPGAVQAPLRDRLIAHLDSLLSEDFSTYPLDGAVVDQARRVFSRLPMAARVYTRLRTAGADVQPWRPADAVGPAGRRYFTLASGRPLAEAAVPGFYTTEGLNRVLLPRLPNAILEAASEVWVLGPEAASALTADPRQLETAVLRLYAEDYVRHWRAVLDGIVLTPFRNLREAAEALNLLGAPNSPMRDLMASIARQLSLAPPPAAVDRPAAEGGSGGEAPAGGAAQTASASGGAASTVARIAEAVGAARQNAAAVVAQIVDERFHLLRESAGKPLDEALAVVNDLYVQVARLASSPPGTVPPSSGAQLDPVQRLAAAAQRAPEPLSRWLGVIAQSTGSVRAGGTRATLSAAATQQLTPFCRRIETKFPFSRDPNAPDMPLGDFVRLFGPSGLFDQFFTQSLRYYIDTSQRPWRPVATDGLAPPVSPADVVQFQRAAAIRDAFFPGGSSAGLRFELLPVALDGGASGATLDVEGASTAIAPGGAGARPVLFQWPSRGPVSLTFDPASTAGPVSADGPWAALKFVAKGRLAPGRAPDRLRLLIQQAERAAEFELRTGSVVHPFALRELLEFRCPLLPP